MTPLPRTKLGRRIDWLIVVAFALMAAGALRAQGSYPTCYTTTGIPPRTFCPDLDKGMSPALENSPRPETWVNRLRISGIVRTEGTKLCGVDEQYLSPNIDLLQVACVDYDALRAAAPHHPWPTGKVTPVLLHIREGDAVRVTVDGVAKFADLTTDAWGRRIALLVFDGVEHTEVSVRVYRAVDE